jgi:ferredoxin
MFSDYSRMAGGHNPRPTKKERLRNRYLHKLAYFDERYGKTLCVGCGRCISKCPASLDITEVIEWGGGAK